jgi:DNA invertase Pin-like site-specific DNA recombinase
MIYGYARVSTAGQSVACPDAAAHGCRLRESVPRGGVRRQDRPRPASSGTRQGRVWGRADGDPARPVGARSTWDLLKTLATVTDRKAGFRSLGDDWADTTTAHGRLMLTVLGGLAEFERELIRARTSEGRARAKARGQSLGRPHKLTPHQRREALQRKEAGEPVREIARSYAVSGSTISRLAG